MPQIRGSLVFWFPIYQHIFGDPNYKHSRNVGLENKKKFNRIIVKLKTENVILKSQGKTFLLLSMSR